MVSPCQSQTDTVGSQPIEELMNWIVNNMSPEDIFSESELTQWAIENGFTKMKTLQSDEPQTPQ